MAVHAKKQEPEPKPAQDTAADDVAVVAVVSRDVDGKPANGDSFVLLVPEDPTDAELAAAWNDNGKLPPAGQALRHHPRGW